MSATVWDQNIQRWVQRPTRWGMWVFVAVQIVMALVMIFSLAYIASQSGNACAGFNQQTCNDITGWGVLIVFGVVLAVWAAIDIIIGSTVLIVRLSSRV